MSLECPKNLKPILSLGRQRGKMNKLRELAKSLIFLLKRMSLHLYPRESGTVFCLTEESGSSASLLSGALTWSQAQTSVKPQLCLWPGYFLLPVYALEWQTLEKYSQGLTDYTGLRVIRG